MSTRWILILSAGLGSGGLAAAADDPAGAAGAADPSAAPSEDAEAIYNQGLERYSAGDRAGAIELWQRSYEMSRLPAILYNIASAQEESGLRAEALETWKAFLLVAPESDREATQQKIADLSLVLGVPLAPEPAPVVATPTPEPQPVEPVESVEPIKEPRQGSARGIGVGLLGVGGLGATVSGAWLSVQANNQAAALATSDCVSLQGVPLCTDAGTSGLRQERLQYTLGASLVGGGLLLGGSAVLLAISGDGPDTTVGLGPQTLTVTHSW